MNADKLKLRWETPLAERPTCAPAQMRDLTILRSGSTLLAVDDRGRTVWTRELEARCTDGEIAANADILVAASRFEGVEDCTRFDLIDEGAVDLCTVFTEGSLRQGGLVVHAHSVHAWMNDRGLALRKMKLPPKDDVLTESLVPEAQPWDGNVTKRGVVLVGFSGRREGASLWDPRTGSMKPLIRGKDVWSHAVEDDIAVFAIGESEGNHAIVGVDIQSGLELWRRANCSHGVAMCDAGVLVYLGTDTRVPALLDRYTGELLWRSPRVHAGRTWKVAGNMAIAHGPRSLAFDIATGQIVGEPEFEHVIAFEDYFVLLNGDRLAAYDYPTIDIQPHVIVPTRPARATPRDATPVITPRVQPTAHRA